jgi:hypothetical protein
MVLGSHIINSGYFEKGFLIRQNSIKNTFLVIMLIIREYCVNILCIIYLIFRTNCVEFEFESIYIIKYSVITDRILFIK